MPYFTLRPMNEKKLSKAMDAALVCSKFFQNSIFQSVVTNRVHNDSTLQAFLTLKAHTPDCEHTVPM